MSNRGLLSNYRGSPDVRQKLGKSITARKDGLVRFSDHREEMLLGVARDAVVKKLQGCRVDSCFNGLSDRRCAPQSPSSKGLEDSSTGNPGVGDFERGAHGKHLAEEGQERRGILVGRKDCEVALCDVAVISDIERAGPLVTGARGTGQKAVMRRGIPRNVPVLVNLDDAVRVRAGAVVKVRHRAADDARSPRDKPGTEGPQAYVHTVGREAAEVPDTYEHPVCMPSGGCTDKSAGVERTSIGCIDK
ncbi:MAG: hypothetical protein KIT69_21205, partial [Propionibacteriaceae bacterium]|nr:hypothetical protein [Propionibacteriaceae bacterium]